MESPTDLIGLAKREIAQIGLVARKKSSTPASCVSPKRIRSMTRTIAEISRRSEPNSKGAFPTLHLVGRNGMHKYNNQDHAMMTAMLTARNILAGERLYDVWNVNEDAEYHELGESGAQGALDSVRLVPEKTERAA